MILIDNYSQVSAQIETERGISRESLAEAIETALVSACKRSYPEEVELDAHINSNTGEATIWELKEVVDKNPEEHTQITLSDAQKIQADIQLGDTLRKEITPSNFGRLAAQTAKQVIIQRIREAEKQSVYEDFQEKVGKIITGTVQKIEGKNYLINLGRIEAILPFREQIPGERYEVKDKIRLYVVAIDKTPKGPMVRISRSHPGLLKCLFELEVPEIPDNIIEIISVSREAGKRAKVAVKSNNPNISAVGTCVGHMGGRIQAITKEIGNEKIDILDWNEDTKKFIASSLKPASITDVRITSEEEKTAVVIVPNDQLSLAIGKMGINVRLAVKLTNWKLDIINENEFNESDIESDEETLSLSEKLMKLKDESEESENNEEGSVSENSDEDSLTKVSELAKTLNLKTQDLIDEAAKHGIEIKNNRAKLDEETVEKVNAIFA